MDSENAQAWGRALRRNDETAMLGEPGGSPFIDMPSAVDIAHFFIEEHCQDFDGQGAEGIPLYREERDYSYIWMEAHVDHDLEQYFLLDIRTNIGDNETRDYLWVMVGVGCKVECEWHNQPVSFGADYETHMDRFVAGMKWFTNNIVAKRDELAEQAGE